MLAPSLPSGPPKDKKNKKHRCRHVELPIRRRDELKTNDNEITKAKKSEWEETLFLPRRPQRDSIHEKLQQSPATHTSWCVCEPSSRETKDARLSPSVPEAETPADWSDRLLLIVSANVNLALARSAPAIFSGLLLPRRSPLHKPEPEAFCLLLCSGGWM